MGRVIKQSFWTAIISYLGVGIGYANTMILMPLFFTEREMGVFLQAQSAILMIAPIAVFGIGSAVIKYYATYRNQIGSFISLLIKGLLAGFGLTLFLFVVFKNSILNYFSKTTPEIEEFYWLIVVVSLLLALFTFFESIARANLNTIISGFLRDTVVRILKTLIVVSVGLHFVSFSLSMWLLIPLYGFVVIVIGYYSFKNNYFRSSNNEQNIVPIEKKPLFSFALFSIIGSVGSAIVMNIDSQMITAMIGPEANAIYGIALFMAMTIDMPKRAISQIMIPILSEAMNKNNFDKVKSVYRQLSINQSILGLTLLLLIVINLENIYSLIPNGERFVSGEQVVLIIGLTRVLDMIFSSNSEIIAYSNYYKVNFILILFLGIITIWTNQIFIPKYGVEGAAYASFMAVLSFNFIKFVFIKWKFGIQPFTFKLLIPLILSWGLIYLNGQISSFPNVFIDLPLRSFVTVTIFLSGNYLMKTSNELNGMVSHWCGKLIGQKID